MQIWLYHTEYGAKLHDISGYDAIPALEKQGWCDSPAKLIVVAVKEDVVPVKARGGKNV